MDRREIILQRVLVVLQTLRASPPTTDQPFKTVERNLDQVAATQRPACVLLDAHEMVDRNSLVNINKPSNAPDIVDMSPQIIVSLQNTKNMDDVGTRLNGLRLMVLDAILHDTTLAQLMSPNGVITYEGCGTSLARGGAIEGEMGINLCFHYPLIPEEFS